MTRQNILLLVIGSVLISGVMGYKDFPEYAEDYYKFYFVIEMESSTNGISQLFFNTGHKFRRQDSSGLKVTNRGFQKYSFPVPRSIESIRFDPINKSSILSIRNAGIENAMGDKVKIFPVQSFRAAKHINKMDVNEGVLTIHTVEKAYDPILLIDNSSFEDKSRWVDYLTERGWIYTGYALLIFVLFIFALFMRVNQVSQSAPYKTAYRSEIDGLRAFAVLSVVVFHAFPQWSKEHYGGGFIGVDIFFVISGFLITSHIFENLDKGQFSFTDFFGRRIRRIFPALIIVMASSLAFGWFVLLADEYAQLGKHVASGAAFILNFILVDESGYFDNAAETKLMLHLWSLAVEEQFYIIWPLILWAAWKRKFNLITITILVAVVSFYLNLQFVSSMPIETFFWPVGRFWELLSGSVLAWLFLFKGESLTKLRLWVDGYVVRIIPSKDVSVDGTIVSNTLSLFGFMLLAYGVIRINEGLPFPSMWALVPILGALLVISGGSKAWLNRVFLMNPIAIWFGLISYPLYLWHWPILSFLQIIDGESFQRWEVQIGAVLVAIILAHLTYKFIEQPIRFGRQKKKVNAFFLLLLLYLVGAVGYWVSKTDLSDSHGFEDRLFNRKDFEHGFGVSLKWYKGKDDWLFLGNAEGNTVSDLKLSEIPSDKLIKNRVGATKKIADDALISNTRVALLIGPNKSTVYPEYLPKGLTPSKKRYISFFIEAMSNHPNLTVHDPSDDLLIAKGKEGMLYFKTGTHWNRKGAYISYKGLLNKLDISAPQVNFELNTKNKDGVDTDLIKMAKLADFPIPNNANWIHIFANNKYEIHSKEFSKGGAETPFGKQLIVYNSNPITPKKIWVIGDSFAAALRPYLERTFSEVHYIGRSKQKVLDIGRSKQMALELLALSSEKPDLILIVQVERDF